MTAGHQRQAAAWFTARCEALALDGRVRAESATVRDIAVQASEPLRVAVAGVVSTGKSGLVNALLGTGAARVARDETTSRIAWYRDPALPVPPPLGEAHDFEPVDFPLSGKIVLIDTPGLDTVSGNELLTETMFSAKYPAAGAAGALAYLVAQLSEVEVGLRWIRRFAALNGGPFELHAGITILGTKADLYETGGSAQGSTESKAGLIDDLREAVEETGGHPVGHVGAMTATLAALARTEVFSDELLAQIELVAGTPELRKAAHGGWPLLEDVAKPSAIALDVERLSDALGSSLSLASAADLLAEQRPADPRAAVRRLWLGMSGLDDLEKQLSTVAAAGTTLTITAVVRRLERLAARLGPNLGEPVRTLLAHWRGDGLSQWHDRHCAALVLEGDELAYLPPEDRLSAARMLRGEGDPLTAPMRARWVKARAGWRVTSRDAKIIRMVLDPFVQQAGSAGP